jgi:hypothetical protein
MTTTNKVGDSVVCNGHLGTISAVTDYGMVEVQLEGGTVCVDPSDLQPGSVWDVMVKCARSDMRLARKEGSILIAQTRRGTVELTYSERAYEINVDGRGVGRASTVKAAEAMIAPLYQVEIG